MELYLQNKISKDFFSRYNRKIDDLEKNEVTKGEYTLFEKCPLCGKGPVIKIEREENVFIIKIKEVKYVCASCGSVWKGGRGSYKLVKASLPTLYAGENLTISDWKCIGKTGLSRYHLLLKELAEGNFLRLKKPNQNEVPMILKHGEIALFFEENCVLYEPVEKWEYQESFAGILPGMKNLAFLLGGSRGSVKNYIEIDEIDRGTIVLTNWRLVFIGAKKTYTIFPTKIVKVEIFKDSIVIYEIEGIPKSFSVDHPEILGNAIIGVSKNMSREEERYKENPISNIKMPEEEEFKQLDKIKKIIEYYNKKGYNVVEHRFKDPILKVTLSKNDKTYLATINIKTNKVEYENI